MLLAWVALLFVTVSSVPEESSFTLNDLVQPHTYRRLFDTLSASVASEYEGRVTSFDESKVIEYDAPTFSIKKLNEKYSSILYESDMVIHPERLKEIVESSIDEVDEKTGKRIRKRKAFVDYSYPKTIWTQGVPYSIHRSVGDEGSQNLVNFVNLVGLARENVIRAIAFWQAETCINFRPRTNEKQFVEFIGNDEGCWSTVGKDEALGRQVVSIGRGCEHFGVTSHELAHSLGVFHEQSRYDRDVAVQLNKNVVPPPLLFNFAKISPRELNTYRLPYDVGSVMHYTPTDEGFSDDQLSSCCGIIANRYSSATFLSNECVLSSVLSLLLAVISRNGGQMLADKLCEWITGSIESADDLHCKILFNALDVLADISSKGETNNLKVPVVMAISMVRKYPKEFASVDIDRFVSTAPTAELLNFVYLLSDVDMEISGSIWDKAAGLLAVSKAADGNLCAFVTNQLAIGMLSRSPQSISRFKSCIEKLSCVQPDPEFLFAFCKGMLSQLRGHHLPVVSQLLPIWIYAVLAFSKSRELDTKGFTSMIWDHIARMLVTVDEHATVEFSPGNSETFLTRFISVLGDNASSDGVRRIVADAVPFQLANQIVTLLKIEEKDLQERLVRVCCEILRQLGPTLLAIAEDEAPRIGLNRTAFVVLTQAVVSKMVKNPFSRDFLLQAVPTCISALARLPYRMFIYSRIKDLLLKFGTEPSFSCRIVEELTSSECSAHYSQLTKETDQRIRRILENRSAC